MDLDFSGLLANCSDKGRTGYNPIMMYAVVTYANMRGVRAVGTVVSFAGNQYPEKEDDGKKDWKYRTYDKDTL